MEPDRALSIIQLRVTIIINMVERSVRKVHRHETNIQLFIYLFIYLLNFWTRHSKFDPTKVQTHDL